MAEREDGRTARVTAGEGSIARPQARRRPRGPLWAWIVGALVLCVLVGWAVYAALP